MAYSYSGITPATDSGVQGDSITNNTSPVFYGTGNAGGTIYLYLFDKNTGYYSFNGNSTVDGNGNWTISATSPLAENITGIYIQEYDNNGQNYIDGGPQSLTIDTTPPPEPTGLLLASQTDSGVLGDHITNYNMPTISGNAEANGTVIVQDGSDVLGQVQADGNGNWTFADTALLGDGTHYIYASETDVAGNVSNFSSPLQIVIDTQAPSVPLNTVITAESDSGVAGDGITNDNAPTLTGTVDPASTVNLFVDGQTVSSVTADNAGNWRYTFNLPKDGTYSITANSQDQAGNLSTQSVPYQLTIDTTPPQASAPTLSASRDSGLQGDNITSFNQPSFYGTAEVGSSVTISDGTTDTPVSVNSSGQWNYFVTSPLADGVYNYTTTETDAAGNVSAPSQALTLTIDTTAPTAMTPTLAAATDTGISGDNITANNQPTFYGTTEVGSTLTISDGTTTNNVNVDSNGQWDYFTTTPLTDGVYNYTVTETDTAGNVSTPSQALQLTIDTTAPTASAPALSASTDSGVQGDNITSNNQPTFYGTATIPGDRISISNGTTNVAVPVNSDGQWNYSIPSPLADGVYNYTVTETDAAGNVSASSQALQLTIDTTPPTAAAPTLSASRDSGVQGDNITSYNQPSFYGTAEVGSTLTISDGTTVTPVSVSSSGQWSYFAPSALPDGVYNFTATETDAAGNVSAPSQALQLTIDTTAPTASTPALSANTDSGIQGDNITSNNQPTFYGTATTPGDKIYVSNGTTTVNVPVNSNGQWNYSTPSPLADGVYNYTVNEIDAAGNVSVPSQTLQLTIDTTAPLQPTLELSTNSDSNIIGDNITNNNLPSISGKAEAGSNISVQVNGNNYGTTLADQSGNWTLIPGTMPPLADGNYLVTASAMDAAGNLSTQGSSTITIDTTPPLTPAIPALTSATDTGAKGDSITGNTMPTLTGTAEANTSVFLIDITNDSLLTITQADAMGNWSFSYPTALTDGNYSVAVGSGDAAGNFSNLSSNYNFTVDSTAPTTVVGTSLEAATDSGVQGDNVTNNNLPSLAGTTEAMSTVVISGIGSNTYTTQADASGKWEYKFISPVADGNYAVQVMATDLAGNTATLTNGFMLTIDTTAPATSTAALSQANNGMESANGISNNPQPTFVGQAEADSVVAVSILNNNAVVEQASVNTDAMGNWSYTAVNNLASGNYQLSTVVSDVAANQSANTLTAFNIDTTIPAVSTVTATTSSSSNVYAGDTVTFNVSSDKALVVNTTNGSPQLTLNSGAPATYQGTSADGKTLIFSTQIAQGQLSNNLKVTGVDLNGSIITDQAGNAASLANVASAEGSATNIVVGDPVSTGAAGDIFRFFNTGDGSHFYTVSTTEKAQLLATRPDLKYEGTSFRSVDATDPNATNVYRFFDKNDGSHFFTTSVEERDQTIQNRSDLTYEGTNFYEHAIQQAGDVAVYRFFNTQNGSHLFTSDQNEIRATAALPDYKVEGIAFYTSNPNG